MKYFLLFGLMCFCFSCSSSTEYNQKIALEEYGQYIRDSIQAAQKTQPNEQNNEPQMIVTTPNKVEKSDWRKDISLIYGASKKTFKRDKINISLYNKSEYQDYTSVQVKVDFFNSSGYVIAQREKTFNIILQSKNHKNVAFETEFPKTTNEINVSIIDARKVN